MTMEPEILLEPLPDSEGETFETDYGSLCRRLAEMTEDELIKYAKEEMKRLEDWTEWQRKVEEWEEEQRRLEEERKSWDNSSKNQCHHQLKGATMYEKLFQKFKSEGMPIAAARPAARRVARLIAAAQRGHTPLNSAAIYRARRAGPASSPTSPPGYSPVAIWKHRAAAMRR
jgi:hypothetical protein